MHAYIYIYTCVCVRVLIFVCTICFNLLRPLLFLLLFVCLRVMSSTPCLKPDKTTSTALRWPMNLLELDHGSGRSEVFSHVFFISADASSSRKHYLAPHFLRLHGMRWKNMHVKEHGRLYPWLAPSMILGDFDRWFHLSMLVHGAVGLLPNFVWRFESAIILADIGLPSIAIQE